MYLSEYIMWAKFNFSRVKTEARLNIKRVKLAWAGHHSVRLYSYTTPSITGRTASPAHFLCRFWRLKSTQPATSSRAFFNGDFHENYKKSLRFCVAIAIWIRCFRILPYLFIFLLLYHWSIFNLLLQFPAWFLIYTRIISLYFSIVSI